MPSWDDLKYLLALTRHGRMNAAAQSLGINVATVSRRIERLSEILGQPAFIKKAEGWVPSPAIQGLVSLAEEIEQRLEREMNNIHAGTAGHTLQLSIGCPPFVSQYILYPGLDDKGPELEQVSFNFARRIAEEGMGDNDIAVALKRPDSGRIIARRIADLHVSLYRARGAEQNEGWVGFREAYDDVPIMREMHEHFRMPPRIRVESFNDLAEVLAATGLCGPLVDVVGRAHPELERLPSPVIGEQAEMWILFHASRKGDRVLQDTVNWIENCIKNTAQVPVATGAAAR